LGLGGNLFIEKDVVNRFVCILTDNRRDM